jgi:hypothetical protein
MGILLISNKLKERHEVDSLKQAQTVNLSEELETREGVTTIRIEPHQEFKITTGQKERAFQGPAVILVNQD